jgi:hypothetical protein
MKLRCPAETGDTAFISATAVSVDDVMLNDSGPTAVSRRIKKR